MRFLTSWLFLQICINGVCCRNLSINQLLANYIQFNREHPQEKVYLHMDNRSYYIGDTIWFKAYVLNATTLHPTHTSGVLYVDLLNENGVEMEHRKLHIVNGMCYGEFPLKESYRTGFYEIRAYTRNMLNFGNEERFDILGSLLVVEPARFTNYNEMAKKMRHPDLSENDSLLMQSSLLPPRNHCVFSRVFPVYMPLMGAGEYKREMDWYPAHDMLSLPIETDPSLRADDLHVAFYPEGGVLVEGIRSVVAFEATDQWGRKCEIEGRIVDQEKTITTIETTRRGRGKFQFCPISGRQYTAVVVYKEKEYRFMLPEAKQQGYTLQVSPPIGNGKAMLTVKGAYGNNPKLLGLALQCRGSLLAFDTLRVQDHDSVNIAIDYKQFAAGVNQFTLFDEEGRVYSDRLFFVNPTTYPATLAIQHIPDSLIPYQKVSLDISVRDNSYRGSSRGFFSLSVTDEADSVPTYDTRDIRSELLLASDLKGFVENVDSYFEHSNDTAMAADLDLLMLVQGWRRYEWETMSGLKLYHPRYSPERGLAVDGYVISDQTPQGKSIFFADNYPRIPSLKMKISLSGEYIGLHRFIEADSLGNFSVDLNCLAYDYAHMKIKLYPTELSRRAVKQNKLSMRHSYVVINRVFSPLSAPFSYYQSHTPDEQHIVIDDTTDWAMESNLNEVTIQKRRKRKGSIHYERPEITIDYYKEWNNLIDRGIPGIFEDTESFLRDKLSIDYSLRRNNLFSAYVKSDSVNSRRGAPYVLPKTIRVYSNVISRDSIQQLDPQTENRHQTYCIVDYQSRNRSPIYPPYQSRNNVRYTYFEGYSRVANFYSPDYSECALPDTADYRRTLLWVPNIETDFYGNASVTFYNNKQTKHLHVRAEGITEHGEFIVYDSKK